MKKMFSLIALFAIFAWFNPTNTYSSDTGYFVVTAYYSPLPDQDFYIMWNYEAEVRMNGRWTNGASGAPVFSGMLAAPGKYSFWTKIYLEWLGIGDVQDRGGAIVPAGQRGYSHDRIDVWVWKWEEWLRRAMYWGKRKVKWHLVSGSKQSTLNYNTIPAPLWASNNLKAAPKIPSFFNQPLWTWSNKKSVEQLQEFLTQANLYEGNISGVYNNAVIDAIFDFQVSNNLISYENEYGAGYWGTQTRKLFLKKYLSGTYKQPVLVESDWHKNIFEWPANSPEKVELLQGILTQLDLYSWEINGDYSDVSPAIFEFQVIHELIDSNYHPAAGWFGPKTRETLNTKYQQYLEQQEILAVLEEKKLLLKQDASKKANKILESIWDVDFWEVSSKVRALQTTLATLWYFNHKDTAIFGKVTSNSILKFQIDNDLVRSANDIGAGNYWPKTREALEESLTTHMYEEKVTELEESNTTEQDIAEITYFTA